MREQLDNPLDGRGTPDKLHVTGAGRDAQHDRSIVVYLNRSPTDDELRQFHEYARLASGVVAASPLLGRDDLRIDGSPDHPLTRSLLAIVDENQLHGAVLLTIDGEWVGVNSSARDAAFGVVMNRLADAILAGFSDGTFYAALEGR